MIYAQKWKIGLDGTASRNIVTIDFLLRTQMVRGNAGFETLTDACAAELRKILTKRATIIAALYSPQVAKGATPYGRGHSMNRRVNLPGLREVNGDPNLALTSIVSIFGKDCAYGDAGVQRIRGTLFSTEFDSSASGTPILKAGVNKAAFEAFGALYLTACSNNNAPLVMAPAQGDQWDSGHRLVTSMTYGGLGQLQDTFHSKTKKELEDDIIRRTINEIAKKYRDAQRGEGGIIVEVVGAVLNALMGEMGGLIAKYTLQRILGFALPAPVKKILALMPA